METEEEFKYVVREHRRRYPQMEPQDFGKLAYQSEYGPGHLLADPARALDRVAEEWRSLAPGGGTREPEDIGNGLFRFPLTDACRPEEAAPLLGELLLRTAKSVRGTEAGLERRLSALAEFEIPGMEPWLEDWRRAGCPPVGHSRTFREAYAPHYRLLRAEYACFFPALLAVQKLLKAGKPALIAVDGRCGSGKTGLASVLAALFPCRVLHLDDFYLPFSDRAEGWEQLPAGNMDLLRFDRETLLPASRGETVFYRPYDCRAGRYRETAALPPEKLTVAEGSYSTHPSLAARYDLKIFTTCPPAEQLRRLRNREGPYAEAFQTRWIPMEERYFQAFSIEQKADLTVDTGGFFRGDRGEEER